MARCCCPVPMGMTRGEAPGQSKSDGHHKRCNCGLGKKQKQRQSLRQLITGLSLCKPVVTQERRGWGGGGGEGHAFEAFGMGTGDHPEEFQTGPKIRRTRHRYPLSPYYSPPPSLIKYCFLPFYALASGSEGETGNWGTDGPGHMHTNKAQSAGIDRSRDKEIRTSV